CVTTMCEYGRVLFYIHILHPIQHVSGINLVHAIHKIIPPSLVGGCVVVILKELPASGEKDIFEAPHRIVGISEMVASSAAYVHACQSPIVIVGGIINGLRAQSGDDLLLLRQAPGSIIVAVNVRDDVRVPTVCSVFGFSKPAKCVTIEKAQVNDAVIPVG